MRFVTFNVNGIRARTHQLEALVEKHNPDLLALQETKVIDDDFPEHALTSLGYEHFTYYGQKGHYGVALASRTPLTNIQLGFPWRETDQQRRFIGARTRINDQDIVVINGYFPQGEQREHPTKFPGKATFYADLQRYLNETLQSTQSLIIAGDMNIAPSDSDIGIGPDNAKRWLRTGKASFLPEEREWLQAIFDWGVSDCYEQSETEDERLYSWFDYRSRGFEREPKRGLRIDLILATQSLHDSLVEAGIDYEIRSSEKPSDHCPVWAEFRL